MLVFKISLTENFAKASTAQTTKYTPKMSGDFHTSRKTILSSIDFTATSSLPSSVRTTTLAIQRSNTVF